MGVAAEFAVTSAAHPRIFSLLETRAVVVSGKQTLDKMHSKILCRICKQEVDGYSYCSACGANFCDTCWKTQIPHDPNSTAEPRHEKSDRQITERLQCILTPATDQDAQRQLHLDDSLTTWLKWTKGFRQEPELQEYDRYKKLMQASFSSQWKERWPQFVSFIGQTGKLQINPKLIPKPKC